MRKLSVAIVAAVVLFAPGQARADHFWDQNCDPSEDLPCTADNYQHTYCWGDNFDGDNWRDAAKYAMENLAAQSDFWDYKDADCHSESDVVWVMFNEPGVRGRYNCVEDRGENCEKARVLLHAAEINDDDDPELNRKKTSCHEVGHSGGLSHSDDVADCMKSGEVQVGHKEYNGHHVDHLNDNF
jgi:hypothetical protein